MVASETQYTNSDAAHCRSMSSILKWPSSPHCPPRQRRPRVAGQAAEDCNARVLVSGVWLCGLYRGGGERDGVRQSERERILTLVPQEALAHLAGRVEDGPLDQQEDGKAQVGRQRHELQPVAAGGREPRRRVNPDERQAGVGQGNDILPPRSVSRRHTPE